MYMQYMQYFANLKINSIWISNIQYSFDNWAFPLFQKAEFCQIQWWMEL